MTFREFVTDTREAVAYMIASVQPPEIVPALHVDGPRGMHILALAGEFFESNESRGRMLDQLLPVVESLAAERVAWSFETTASQLVVVAMDREVHETWIAPLTPDGWPRLGEWQLLPPNQQVGLLLTPMQKALR